MKIVLAIVGQNDAGVVMDALTEERFQVTKLATTGGFLKAGNTTLLTGVEDEKVSKVIDIISKYSSKRSQVMAGALPMDMDAQIIPPIEVTVGGATIFVLDVDRYEKV